MGRVAARQLELAVVKSGVEKPAWRSDLKGVQVGSEAKKLQWD
jgi:hypothetical protein